MLRTVTTKGVWWASTQRKQMHFYASFCSPTAKFPTSCHRKCIIIIIIIFKHTLLEKLNERGEKKRVKSCFRILPEAVLHPLLKSVILQSLTVLWIVCFLFIPHRWEHKTVSSQLQNQVHVLGNCRIREQSKLSLNAYIGLINKWFILIKTKQTKKKHYCCLI